MADATVLEMPRRQWLLGLEPVFESKWDENRAESGTTPGDFKAVAVLGDVTLDLSYLADPDVTVAVSAYAIFRDVDITVSENATVLSGGGRLWGDIPMSTRAAHDSGPVIRISAHALTGDVTVRRAG